MSPFISPCLATITLLYGIAKISPLLSHVKSTIVYPVLSFAGATAVTSFAISSLAGVSAASAISHAAVGILITSAADYQNNFIKISLIKSNKALTHITNTLESIIDKIKEKINYFESDDSFLNKILHPVTYTYDTSYAYIPKKIFFRHDNGVIKTAEEFELEISEALNIAIEEQAIYIKERLDPKHAGANTNYFDRFNSDGSLKSVPEFALDAAAKKQDLILSHKAYNNSYGAGSVLGLFSTLWFPVYNYNKENALKTFIANQSPTSRESEIDDVYNIFLSPKNFRLINNTPPIILNGKDHNGNLLSPQAYKELIKICLQSEYDQHILAEKLFKTRNNTNPLDKNSININKSYIDHFNPDGTLKTTGEVINELTTTFNTLQILHQKNIDNFKSAGELGNLYKLSLSIHDFISPVFYPTCHALVSLIDNVIVFSFEHLYKFAKSALYSISLGATIALNAAYLTYLEVIDSTPQFIFNAGDTTSSYASLAGDTISSYAELAGDKIQPYISTFVEKISHLWPNTDNTSNEHTEVELISIPKVDISFASTEN